MTAQAPQIHSKRAAANKIASIDLSAELEPSETLTGTPTITEVGTAELTISNISINSGDLVINGETVPAGEAIQCLISGGTVGSEYALDIEADTNGTPAQHIVGTIRLRVC